LAVARSGYFVDVLLHGQVGIQKNTQIANGSNWLNHLGADRQRTISRFQFGKIGLRAKPNDFHFVGIQL